jgi:hypothetical protein
MKELKILSKLCKPAYLYFILSMFVIVFTGIQNLGNVDRYCMGEYSCQVPNTFAIFIGQLLYIVFWTWVLNLICKAGYAEISWLLVLFPFILFFVLVGILFIEAN